MKAQTAHDHLSAQEKQNRYDRIMRDAAFAKSWFYVKEKLNHPKSIKFSDTYDYGDHLGDSTYCISSHFTVKGRYGEPIGQYYYCWLKILNIKEEKWALQKLQISSFPIER